MVWIQQGSQSICKGYFVAAVQPKKVESKYDERRGMNSTADDGPLDDPIAEKLRQQRLVEESDFKATMELFGSGTFCLSNRAFYC